MMEMEIAHILMSLGLSGNAARILVFLNRIYPKKDKWAGTKDLEKVVKMSTVSLEQDFVKERFLFCWDKIPGSDNEKLIDFLRKEYKIDWVSTEKIEKADDKRTIKIYSEINYILLSLNKNNSKVKLELDGFEQSELIVKSRYEELKIYKPSIGNERRIRKKQNPLNIALKELKEHKERNWVVEKIIYQYLFSWKDIPGNDSEILTDFLKSNYDVDWIKKAKMVKTDHGKTIRITAGNKSLSMVLNNKNTELNLIIENVKTDKFIVKTENGKLNIYIYPNEQKKNKSGVLIFANKKYMLKENFDYIIDDLEKQQQDTFNEETAKIQHLRYSKDDKDLIETFISLGIREKNAKTLGYLMKVKEATSNTIMENTGLKLPEISIAVKILKECDWIIEREDKHGTGRPKKIYSLKVDLEKIIAELKKQPKKSIDIAQKDIVRLREIINLGKGGF